MDERCHFARRLENSPARLPLVRNLSNVVVDDAESAAQAEVAEARRDRDVSVEKDEQQRYRLAVACLASRRDGGAGALGALPQLAYRVRPALACIIGARRAWTVEIISSVSIPCRYVPVVDRCECPSWRWISGSGIPSCSSSTACAWRNW